MNKAILIIILLSLSSCKIIKYAGKEHIEPKSSVQEFSVNASHQMIITSLINGNVAELIFDTGNSTTSIFDSAFINIENLNNSINFGRTTYIDGKKSKSQYVPINLENDLFLFEDYLIQPNFNFQRSKCSENGLPDLDGLLGMTFISKLKSEKHDAILNLDYDKNTIKLLSENEMVNFLSDFQIINSKFFQGKHFQIELEINHKKDFYLFDTGNSAFDILSSENIMKGLMPTYQLEGNLTQSLRNHINSTYSIYVNHEVKYLEQNENATISVSPAIQKNNVGLNFIRKFNWIIDFNNKKVYLQKRDYKSKEIKQVKVSKDYFVRENNGEIEIGVRKKGMNKYAIGQKITKVDHVKITEDNLCYYIDLLQKTDWGTLRIEVE